MGSSCGTAKDGRKAALQSVLIMGNGLGKGGLLCTREEGTFVLPGRAGPKAALCTVLFLGNGIEIGAASLLLQRGPKRRDLCSLLRE